MVTSAVLPQKQRPVTPSMQKRQRAKRRRHTHRCLRISRLPAGSFPFYVAGSAMRGEKAARAPAAHILKA